MTEGFLKALQFVQQIYYYVLDWIWTIKIPGTNIPLWVLWITGLIMGIFLMIFNSNPNLNLNDTKIKQSKLPKFSSKNKNSKGNKK